MPARSKAWVCGSSLAGIAGFNFAVDMAMSRQLEVSATGRSLVRTSPTECDVSSCIKTQQIDTHQINKFDVGIYEGWNFNSGNYLFTTDTK